VLLVFPADDESTPKIDDKDRHTEDINRQVGEK
jgi:hypothetical protein